MAYTRENGRKLNELRKIEAEVGIIPQATGSARFKIGNTEAIAAVYGPKEMFPRFMKDPTKGILRCHYNMMPFSGLGNRVRPGGNRRSKELSFIMERALSPVIDLSQYPNSMVEISVEFPQTDAGSRCAAICAASMAMADAGLSMKDLVSSVAAGMYDDTVILDPDYEEDSYENGVDMPLAMINSTKGITLLQMDGVISKEKIMECVELSKGACEEIYEIQKQALKNKFAKQE